MKERVLVFGGGGPAGIAWHVGLAAGLASEGFDFAKGETLIGTSAGSFAGAQLAAGFDPQALAELHKTFSREAAKRPSEPAPRIEHLLSFMQRHARDAPPSADAMVEMGKLALAANTVDEATFVATFSGMFGPEGNWPERFACVSVDVRAGAFKLWRRADGVSIERAVAASCSVPGVYPPVALSDSLWMDGGVRSWTNADLAAGHRRAIVFAVVLPYSRDLALTALERERSLIEAAGGKVETIMPDAATIAVVGDNAMDGRRAPDITDAGIAQGRREAARLRAFWD